MSSGRGNARGGQRGGRGGGSSDRGRGHSSLPFYPRGGSQTASPRDDHRGDYRGGGRAIHRDEARGGRGGGRGGGQGVFEQGKQVPKPDEAVATIETKIESALRADRQLVQGLPPRPGYGTRGSKVMLWTNHFRMSSDGNLAVHRYDIHIAGPKPPVGKRLRRLVEILIEDKFSKYSSDVATDFKSILFSRVDLSSAGLQHSQQYRTEGEDAGDSNGKYYDITLQATGIITISELLDHLASTDAISVLASKEQIIQALNIIVGMFPKSNPDIGSIGANKHYQLNAPLYDRFDLGAGLTALRGFFVSVRAATGRLLVNVQVKNAAFYNEGPLDVLMETFAAENRYNLALLERFLKKLTVDALHIKNINKRTKQRIPRIKSIYGLATPRDGNQEDPRPKVARFGAGPNEVEFYLSESGSNAPLGSSAGNQTTSKKGKGRGNTAQVELSGGGYISVTAFFKKHWNIQLKNTKLPVLNVGTRDKPIYLPAEVCSVIRGQPARSMLSANQTRNMIKFAVRRPAENAQSIVTAGARILGIKPPPVANLSAYGLSIIPDLLTVWGRVLDKPSVKYASNNAIEPSNGGWNMRNVRFAEPKHLSSWTYLLINLAGSKSFWSSPAQMDATLKSFSEVLKSTGMQVSAYVPGRPLPVTTENAEKEIKQALARIKSATPRITFVLVILSSPESSLYNAVKLACDVDQGLLCQCVLAERFIDAKPQYCANVALKINLKLGGRNQALDGAKLGIISEGKTMVIGLDVTHPAPGADGAPSVAGIVASTDRWLGQWPAALRIQTGRQEMIRDLEEMVRSRLQLWRNKNKVLPENLLVFRDGVSEGQFNLVLEQELPAIRKACQSLYPKDMQDRSLPRVTLLIVGKRHHVRFYATSEKEADRSGNPNCGTVVDTGVTDAREWELYLQSHSALQGTARPAHYNVLLDEVFPTVQVKPPFSNRADILEDLIHNMCYMFGRATRAVSIVPPAYYADLVCERARCYIAESLEPASSAVSSAGTSASITSQDQVTLHRDVENAMFYI